MPPNPTRLRVIALYKELHRLGRDYPDPAYNFNGRMRRLFEKNKNLSSAEDIENALKLGEYIKNETLALYSLRKYRTLKRMYGDDSMEMFEESLKKTNEGSNLSGPRSPPETDSNEKTSSSGT